MAPTRRRVLPGRCGIECLLEVRLVAQFDHIAVGRDGELVLYEAEQIDHGIPPPMSGAQWGPYGSAPCQITLRFAA